MEENIADLKVVFSTLPGSNVLVLPNPPLFTITAVSRDYLTATTCKEDEIIGKGLFEVFPNNPIDRNLTSEKTVRASLEFALQHKEPHYLPLQRYDISKNGTYEERYWLANNKPVISGSGEVVYLIHHVEDVTDKVKAEIKEGQLKGIEKAFSLFMHAPMVVGLVKGDDHILELANEAALKLWGKTSEIIGKPLLQVIPELAGQGIIELFDKVKQSRQSYLDKEVPVSSFAEGKEEVSYFNLVYQPYFDDDSDTATGVFTLSYDVTQMVVAKKRVEEARKEAERQKRLYETINRNIPDLIYVFDLNYRFTYANKALLDMWGKTWEQSIGKGLLENGYEPWHAQMHEREIDVVVATKQPIRGEVSFRHATLGTRVYDYIFVPVVDEKGEVEAVAGTTRDISEIRLSEQTIRESEERFRKLADESPMFVFIVDVGSTAPVSYWNRTWLQYTGQSLEEAIERAWDGIIHPDDVPIVMEHYLPAFENMKPYFIPSVRVKRYDGEYLWHTFKGNPRVSTQGEFNGYVGVGFDINNQKLSEDVLKQSEAQLQKKVVERTVELESTVAELKRSNANLEEFAYAASHDLKEPIRKILTFSDRLKHRLKDRLQTEDINLLEKMERATERMQLLIDDLLNYSHVSTSGNFLEEVDLNKKVAKVLEDLELEIIEKNAKVTVGTLPVIKGHKRQIQQVFQNLISNAIKFKKPDVAPEIRISSTVINMDDINMSENGKHLEKQLYNLIEISDNGIGFEQEYAEQIFKMFQRLHGKTEYEGTGIGLAIVKKAIDNHKGYIKAQSKPGEGATFKIFLPAQFG